MSLAVQTLEAQTGTCAPAPTALVLSGGGAKGLAHVGLLQTLDSLGIVPDFVVGTSIGAVVGALYASGYSGVEVDSVLRSLPLSAAIRRYEPQVSNALQGLRPIVVWDRFEDRWILQTGAVRESEVNAIVSRAMLRGNLKAQGNFDNLPIPFRAVATDLNTRRAVSLSSGDLAEAVRASFAIPIVLRPVRRDSLWLTDGGIASNIPVGIARALGAQRLIVSTLPSADADHTAFDDPLNVTTTIFDYIWVQDSLGLNQNDVHVSHPTQNYSLLDFDTLTMSKLVKEGRRTADSVFATGVCARPDRGARNGTKLPTRIRRTYLGADVVRDRDAVIREGGLTSMGPLDPKLIADGLSRFGTAERYSAIWLNPTPAANSEEVDLNIKVDPAPSKSFGIGLGFDHWMSGKIWIGGVNRQLFGHDLESAGFLSIGTYRTDLMLSARRRARVRDSFVPIGLTLNVFNEDVRIYFGDGELPSARVEELEFSMGIRPLLESGWTYELGPDYRLWREPGLKTRGTAGVSGAVRRRIPGEMLASVDIEGLGLAHWQRFKIDMAGSLQFGSVELRPRLRVGWGNQLPVQHTFTLGGVDGFAGLRLFDLRGDQELFGSFLVRWPIWRALRARVETMAGVVGSGNGFVAQHGDYFGVVHLGSRIGVELNTPVGPIRIEQGFNNQDKRQALIRVGHWF